MKKPILILLSAAVLLLSACSTAVTISYLSPAEIDMSSYRNIAVASTVPYNGIITIPTYMRSLTHVPMNYLRSSSLNLNLPYEVAHIADNQLMGTLTSSGYFNVTPPAITDSMINSSYYGSDVAALLADRNIDAVIIPKITGMSYDEYVSAEEHEVYIRDNRGVLIDVTYEYDFYVNQRATITYQYTIIDARTLQVIAVKNFSDQRSEYTYVTPYGFIPSNATTFFESMLKGFQSRILSQLVPQRKSASVELMENKPKVESLESAYKLAEEGRVADALQAFLSEYRSSGHLPAGYNAAVMLSAQGEIDEAIALLTELQRQYSDRKISGLLSDLSLIKANNEAAQAQLRTNAAEVVPATSSQNIFRSVIGY